MSTSSPRISLATPDQVAALDAVLAHVPDTDMQSDAVLDASLRLHGQLAPVLRRGGQIVDGRRRMRLLTDLGREPWIIDLPLDDPSRPGAAPLLLGRSFYELNACRRELSLAVRAAIADTLATLKKGTNQHSGAGGRSREDAAAAAGVSADTLDRYRKVKGTPDVHAKVMTGALSLPQAVRVVESRALAAKAKAAVSPDGDIGACIDQLSVRHTMLNLIYADPPWKYEGGELSTHAAAPNHHYPVMTPSEVQALPVDRIAAKDAVLFLWTPNCLLAKALEVMEAWGFGYVTHAVWVKRSGVCTPGAIRPVHETLLMGKRGQGLVNAKPAMSSAFVDPKPVMKHSQKPVHFVQELERLYPDAARVELFSRQARRGWMSLGNQVSPAAAAGGKAANDDVFSTPEAEQRGARAKKAGRIKPSKLCAAAKGRGAVKKPAPKTKGANR